MKKFKREERYLVLKVTDIEKYCPKGIQNALKAISNNIDCSRIRDGKEPIEAVVIERGWECSEQAWSLVEAEINRLAETNGRG